MSVRVEQGDCLDVMKRLHADGVRVDSIVTDPPYHLTSIVKRFGGKGAAKAQHGTDGLYARASAGFMGKQWDGGDIAFQPETWKLCYDLMKPGAYIVAFGSSRTFGRMSVAIEDAGFINQPMLGWIFGQGFPKAHRLKAPNTDHLRYGGQALKPALEPIYMGQKPMEGTGTENWLKYGTGALNIDGCRVFAEGESPYERVDELAQDCRYTGSGAVDLAAKPGRLYKVKRLKPGATLNREGGNWRPESGGVDYIGELKDGRWPANLVTDGSPEVVASFPDAPGQQRGVGPENGAKTSVNVFGDFGPRDQFNPRGDAGSAARYFYTAKAGADDRFGSKHPTVKPLDLIRWLVRMITPPDGTVLDCFAGSGTTGVAAIAEGFDAILIEREDEYVADIRERLAFYEGEGRHSMVSKNRNSKASAETDGPLIALMCES